MNVTDLVERIKGNPMGRKFKFGYNAAGVYVGPLKRVHRDKKKPSLAAREFAAGNLDVCLETGVVTTCYRGRIKIRKLQKNHKGYFWLNINRERAGKRGKPDADGRYREQMAAWVHRLAMMKKIAVELAGKNWRDAIRDIDPEIDVDHYDKNSGNNAATNLRLAEHNLHGKRSSGNWTAEDEAAIEEFNRSA